MSDLKAHTTRHQILDQVVQLKNWLVQTSEKVTLDPANPGSIDPTGFYTAKIPSTLLGALIDNGLHTDLLTGNNLQRVSPEPFQSSWWYVNHFSWQKQWPDEQVELIFEGINYSANIWLNGQLISDKENTIGAFRQFSFEVGSLIVPGENCLIVEVFPPKPGDFSIGFVDWNPTPPDNNMGIWRPVILKRHRGVSLHHGNVVSQLLGHDQAALTIEANLHNHKQGIIEGTLYASIDGFEIEMPVSLAPGEKRQISWGADISPELLIHNPRLWWPSHYGDPALYHLALRFEINSPVDQRKVSDQTSLEFGIREVTDYINQDGHRGYKINGLPILIKGAGWSDDIFLRDTHESLEAQIDYVKHMNLNCIRLEGFWGKDQALYDQCDKQGILVMVGWSCHWEHEQYLGKPIDERFGGVIEDSEIDLIAQSWTDQLLWLRHHPSIFVWTLASDRVPAPELERRYRACFEQYDQTRPYLASTGGVGSDQGVITESPVVSDISGPARVKMLGPYAYTPPIYWYTDTHLGGAYGFNTETCPGNNVPPLASMEKMLGNAPHWPINDIWQFHGGQNVFATLDRICEAITKRYGPYSSLEEFTAKAQVLNYELMRPMFEAFQVNHPKATGIIQWMLNAAWPKVGWQLYDHYLRPNGAFYGARKGCEPFHLIYHYGEHAIYMINELPEAKSNITARIQLWSTASEKLFDQSYPLEIQPGSSFRIDSVPEITAPSFLDLRLFDANNNGSRQELSHNFYWLSAQQDTLDYDAEFDDWAFYTPSKTFADFTAFNQLPAAKVDVSLSFDHRVDEVIAQVELHNTGLNIAFFCSLTLHTDEGEEMLPILWDDNYISLLPGERRQICAKFSPSLMPRKDPSLKISGWNL